MSKSSDEKDVSNRAGRMGMRRSLRPGRRLKASVKETQGNNNALWRFEREYSRSGWRLPSLFCCGGPIWR